MARPRTPRVSLCVQNSAIAHLELNRLGSLTNYIQDMELVREGEMRTINVSTEVFAKIWSQRKDNEETEDAILRRLLGCAPTQDSTSPNGAQNSSTLRGFHDRQFDVCFEEGFELFRNRLGTDYKAKASGGRWILADTGCAYDSLNELSRAVGARNENAWVNWFFNKHGQRRPVSELRDPAKIRSRRRSGTSVQPISIEDL